MSEGIVKRNGNRVVGHYECPPKICGHDVDGRASFPNVPLYGIPYNGAFVGNLFAPFISFPTSSLGTHVAEALFP